MASAPNLAEIAQNLLQATIKNIIHDVVLEKHREHKMMMMNLDPQTKLPHCERCNLPRLLEPPLSLAVRDISSEESKKRIEAAGGYCDKKPWCRKPGHDIYGNPFPKADLTGRPPTKKEREAAAKNKTGDSTPDEPPSPGGDGDVKEKLEKGEKKANKIDEKLKKGEYIPWQTCPNCKRSLLITRFAKHLEQCMGLSGRAASRNAMAKMNGTPAGSRGGTPAPSGSQEGQANGRDDDDEEKIKGPGAVRKKVLKKGLNAKLKNGTSTSKGAVAAHSSTSNHKRDQDEMLLDDEDDTVHVQKRQKLARVESAVSMDSSEAEPPSSAVDMERQGSGDGSFMADFVDDAAFEDDGDD